MIITMDNGFITTSGYKRKGAEPLRIHINLMRI